jgi:hypothetical protein
MHKKKLLLKLLFMHKFGANDGARTHDIQDHNLALYQTELRPP